MPQFVVIAFLLLSVASLSAQHTFSIVAIDSITGEIGSAGATCGDSIIWPGTKGAIIISDIVPGRGAIHTQSYWMPENQQNAQDLLKEGKSPSQIIDWLLSNDIDQDATVRQYGVVAWHDSKIESAAHTGENCLDFKDHRTGASYAIQGNILKGPEVLDSMEARFLRKKGSLAERLMAAMQGANMVGADSRCTQEGTSSLSAFIRVAQKNDQPNRLFLDINVAGTDEGVEPIDILQDRFEKWQANGIRLDNDQPIIKVYPNPAAKTMSVESDHPIESIEMLDLMGKSIKTIQTEGSHTTMVLSEFAKGPYLLVVLTKSSVWATRISII